MRASSVAAIAAAQAGNPGAQVQVQMMHPPDSQVPEAGVQGRASCLFGRVSRDRRAWGGFHFLDQPHHLEGLLGHSGEQGSVFGP